ncbi:ATPase [Methyloceanibacter methanicus]|uniref:ATPase n=1 Tax=Methyloceanibacter methanicus TaxID=1774968 RepID=A0A1E3VYP9_9HYPH|nr:ATP12 family protein [Methyloceanibacter methanicus]ODR98642.1 ATPase [Methyloceanibacter methanicus]
MSDQDKKTADGLKAALGFEKPSLPKRFYKDVTVSDEDGHAAILLDGRPVRTPGKAHLAVPNAALAEAIADEWRAQGEEIDPHTMPLTKLANSAIDGVEGQEAAVVDDIVAHAGSDLLCYRASGPEGLLALQTQHWDPVLAWAADALGAPLSLAEGIVHVTQPEASLAALRGQIEALNAHALAALHVMTTLTGSALLPLAVARGELSPEAAWEAAHVDEDWQIGQWGEDAEARQRRQNRKRDFEAAARMLALS